MGLGRNPFCGESMDIFWKDTIWKISGDKLFWKVPKLLQQSGKITEHSYIHLNISQHLHLSVDYYYKDMYTNLAKNFFPHCCSNGTNGTKDG